MLGLPSRKQVLYRVAGTDCLLPRLLCSASEECRVHSMRRLHIPVSERVYGLSGVRSWSRLPCRLSDPSPVVTPSFELGPLAATACS